MIRFPWEGEEKGGAQVEIEIRTRSRPQLVIPCRRLGLGQLATPQLEGRLLLYRVDWPLQGKGDSFDLHLIYIS